MVDGLGETDWSSLTHAYGSAADVPTLLAALCSPDDAERHRALSSFYSTVHHQGDVYASTTASLPFLFELAEDPAAPGRAEVVNLLVSIAERSVDRDHVHGDHIDHGGSAAVLRSRAESFAVLAGDADPRVRAAAVPALALVFDDAPRAFRLLRERLQSAADLAERLAIVAAIGALACRRPECEPDAVAMLGSLAADAAVDPVSRLAAVAHRARCVSSGVTADLVPAAVELLRLMARSPAADRSWASPPNSEGPPADGVPPHVAAAFEDLAHAGIAYAPTTDVLQRLHELLGDRVAERTALLTEQLRSPDPGTRLDAIRMCQNLLQGWRGDHSALVTQVAGLLATDRPEVCAEAAAALAASTPVAEPAREALADRVTGRPPRTWADQDRHRRHGHQKAVIALAKLGDVRALPSLLFALDSGVDDWRAIQVAGHLPAAAGDLVPRLCDLLATAESDRAAGSILGALAGLRAPSSIPSITHFLGTSARHRRWDATCQALKALTAFGTTATSSLKVIRGLAQIPDPRPRAASEDVRSAVALALGAIGANAHEVLPLALSLIGDGVWYRVLAGIDVLGQLGPPAAPALPQLRELLTANDNGIKARAAIAIWDIGGESQAALVLDTLLPAWEQKYANLGRIVACLDRMGAAAEPALPQLKAWLTKPRRPSTHGQNDEDLQHLVHIIINRF